MVLTAKPISSAVVLKHLAEISSSPVALFRFSSASSLITPASLISKSGIDRMSLSGSLERVSRFSFVNCNWICLLRISAFCWLSITNLKFPVSECWYACVVIRLKKKNYVSKLPRHCFLVRVWFSKIQGLIWFFFFFFACLIFFSSFFLWTCLSKYTRKDMTHIMKHFEQQTSSTVFCLVSCSSKIKFHISKLWTTQIWHVCCSEKKMHLGQVFQSVTSFET